MREFETYALALHFLGSSRPINRADRSLTSFGNSLVTEMA
jgi:hypothetical protein